MAQQRESQPGATESQPQISDAELKRAAAAYGKIIAINKEFQQSVQQTQDQNERQQLQNEANQKMAQAVEDSGLDVETYNSIIAQVRANEQLAQKFHELAQKMQ
jgi:ribosome-binding protein aMBF1 (putative translation factor)